MTNEMILWLLFNDATQTEKASYQVTDADVSKWLSTFFSVGFMGLSKGKDNGNK